jgi:ribosomal protein S14
VGHQVHDWLPGQAATRPASIFPTSRLQPSGWASCMNWCPRPFGSPCWSIRPTPHRRVYVTVYTGSCTRHRAAKSGAQRQHRRRDRYRLRNRCARAGRRPFVAADGFFISRRVQFATLTAAGNRFRHIVPAEGDRVRLLPRRGACHIGQNKSRVIAESW